MFHTLQPSNLTDASPLHQRPRGTNTQNPFKRIELFFGSDFSSLQYTAERLRSPPHLRKCDNASGSELAVNRGNLV